MKRFIVWLEKLLFGRGLNRFERSIVTVVIIVIIGNGLALSWIQADRKERIEQTYRACLAQRERTIAANSNVILLADLAEEDGAPRFAEALRRLVLAERQPDGKFKAPAPPACNPP